MHAETELSSNLSASITASYTWAKLLDDQRPVPFMPPLQGKFQLMYRKNKWNFRVHSKWAGSQNRTGEFEEPTDGFIIFGGGVEYTKSKWGGLHVISLQMDNIFNTEYRNHLSRVKSVMPEPGFNASIIYRMYY
jgi:iron complex outermembrane recepter protein